MSPFLIWGRGAEGQRGLQQNLNLDKYSRNNCAELLISISDS